MDHHSCAVRIPELFPPESVGESTFSSSADIICKMILYPEIKKEKKKKPLPAASRQEMLPFPSSFPYFYDEGALRSSSLLKDSSLTVVIESFISTSALQAASCSFNTRRVNRRSFSWLFHLFSSFHSHASLPVFHICMFLSKSLRPPSFGWPAVNH